MHPVADGYDYRAEFDTAVAPQTMYILPTVFGHTTGGGGFVVG